MNSYMAMMLMVVLKLVFISVFKHVPHAATSFFETILLSYLHLYIVGSFRIDVNMCYGLRYIDSCFGINVYGCLGLVYR